MTDSKPTEGKSVKMNISFFATERCVHCIVIQAYTQYKYVPVVCRYLLPQLLLELPNID